MLINTELADFHIRYFRGIINNSSTVHTHAAGVKEFHIKCPLGLFVVSRTFIHNLHYNEHTHTYTPEIYTLNTLQRALLTHCLKFLLLLSLSPWLCNVQWIQSLIILVKASTVIDELIVSTVFRFVCKKIQFKSLCGESLLLLKVF